MAQGQTTSPGPPVLYLQNAGLNENILVFNSDRRKLLYIVTLQEGRNSSIFSSSSEPPVTIASAAHGKNVIGIFRYHTIFEDIDLFDS